MLRSYTYFVLILVAIAVLIPVIVFKISDFQGKVLTFKTRPINDTSYLSRYYQIKYRSVRQTYNYIIDLVKSYSFFCQLIQIGHTSKKGALPGFPIYTLKISSGFPKPIILLIGGIYANDWKSVTSILYVANQLLANCTSCGSLVTTYDWHFIPILNPDGYNYSQSTPVAIQWIKNMARWSIDYTGVNLDYNCDINWKKRYNFNEDTYSGLKTFSETETQILKRYVERVHNYIEMVIILKSPLTTNTYKSPSITYPWSYTEKKPPHWMLSQYLALAGAKAVQLATNTTYRVSQSGKQDRNQHGRIDDWLLSIGILRVLTIQKTFTADLISDPYKSILKAGSEVFAIVKGLATTAFIQPLNYRSTHKRIRIDGRIKFGTPLAAQELMSTVTTIVDSNTTSFIVH